MRQPPGYAKPEQKHMICPLSGNIYELYQPACCCWNKTLSDVLLKQGFKPTAEEPCQYVKITDQASVFLLVYVDNLLLASVSETVANEC